MTQRLCDSYKLEGKETEPPTNSDRQAESDLDEANEMIKLILSMSNDDQLKSTTPKQTEEQDKKQEEQEEVPYWSEEELAIVRAFYENEREYEQEDKALLEQYFLERFKK